MPKTNNNKQKKLVQSLGNNIRGIANTITKNMNSLYRSTYMSTPQQSKDLQNLSDRINSNIDKIVDRNLDMVGIGTPSVSRLYMRLNDENHEQTTQIMSDLEKMFDGGIISDDLYGMFMNNRYLRELDLEIDTVCKYMPKLEEALAVQKDCVLSADHFSKDFLNLEDPKSANVKSSVFAERAKDLKRKYQLARLVEEIYEDTSKYGERFIYRVPYNIAIGKLLMTKSDTEIIASPWSNSVRESNQEQAINETFTFNLNKNGCSITSTTTNNRVYNESFGNKNQSSSFSIKDNGFRLEDNESFKINIEICQKGIIESAVEEVKKAYDTRAKYATQSLTKEFAITEARNKDKKPIEAKGNLTFGPSSSIEPKYIANDGLVNGYQKEVNNKESVEVKAPGCVVKKLDRDKVIPIYIEDMCLGYYYFELRKNNDNIENFNGLQSVFSDSLKSLKSTDPRNALNAVDVDRQDDTVRYVASRLAAFIDKQFVNNNQDLAKEIYMILKYNDIFNTPTLDTLKVSFIPPEDMVHFFFKQDPYTHRGVSDLEKGLIPAKIYCSLYITSAIGKMTRGQDKRVYYIKQTVDTNTAQVLLNAISQIKQNNFNIRQFSSINNVLNITGRFNDYFIPTNSSGDAPIQFEIMPGQQIDAPTDLMEPLEEMAINSTGIPIEIIQTRQSVDYAMQLTMSSSKVLRFCYKRQELFQDLLTEFISPIYNYEYNESVIIKVTLPPPSFINITNTNQLLDNTKSFAQSIVDMDCADEQDDAIKNRYNKKISRWYLGTHLDVAKHQALLDEARMEVSEEKQESHSDGSGDSDY